jgi:hypothetical protein
MGGVAALAGAGRIDRTSGRRLLALNLKQEGRQKNSGVS